MPRWADGGNLARDNLDIYGRLVSGSGVVASSSFPISAEIDVQDTPAVCASSDQYFVVWSDHHSLDSGIDIYGARVIATGTVLDSSGIPVCTEKNEQSSPGE